MWRRGLVRNAAQLPPKKPALVGFENVVEIACHLLEVVHEQSRILHGLRKKMGFGVAA